MKNAQILLVLLTLPFFCLNAQKATIVDSKITIYGSSNVHDWESKVTKVDANGTMVVEEGALTDINNLTVKMKVKSIESSKGSIMDNKTYKALDADKYPTIDYRLTDVKNLRKSGNTYTIDTKGTLAIAGTTRTIDLSVKGKVLGNGNIMFTGSKDLKMTDFKVDPPTAMLGAMKTADDIKIEFSVTMAVDSLR